MKRIMIIVGVIAAIAVLLVGGYLFGYHYLKWWGEPESLKEIKAEPVASKSLLNLELITAEESGKYNFPVKTTSPSVMREFRVESGSLKAIKERVIEYAENDGWVYDKDFSREDEWLGRKVGLKSPQLTLSISEKETGLVLVINAYGSYETYKEF